METKELIKGLSELFGVELELDEDGLCAFAADDLTITIHDLPEVGLVMLAGDLGEPPPMGLEKLYQAMLEAQYLFRHTHGASFARNPENGRFSLCKPLEISQQDVQTFSVETETFVNTVEIWAKIIQDYRGAVAKPTAEPSAESTLPPEDLDRSDFLRV